MVVRTCTHQLYKSTTVLLFEKQIKLKKFIASHLHDNTHALIAFYYGCIKIISKLNSRTCTHIVFPDFQQWHPHEYSLVPQKVLYSASI